MRTSPEELSTQAQVHLNPVLRYFQYFYFAHYTFNVVLLQQYFDFITVVTLKMTCCIRANVVYFKYL